MSLEGKGRHDGFLPVSVNSVPTLVGHHGLVLLRIANVLSVSVEILGEVASISILTMRLSLFHHRVGVS